MTDAPLAAPDSLPRSGGASLALSGLTEPGCRFCGGPLRLSFANLGATPPCQNVVRPEDVDRGETYYPLHALVCEACWLVQIGDALPPEAIFSEYAYFSSYSDSWLAHARCYVETVVERFGLGAKSLVVEVASNDGYLLQYVAGRGIPCLGVEPAANVAPAAEARGVPTRVAFFGEAEARKMRAEGLRADLLLGNNVLAHTPYLNSFVAGIKTLLADQGVVTLEFPHLVRLAEGNQFDTIYHEHFSYFSFTTVRRILAAHGLDVFDVEELPSHGGSLRVYARHQDDVSRPIEASVEALLGAEAAWGVETRAPYEGFADRVRACRLGLLTFLTNARREGRTVVGYGAPGKGNTLLNYCNIGPDLLAFTTDRNPYKQGTFLPGSRIPVLSPEAIREARPDVVLILPWNLRTEIAEQLAFIREWGGQFVVPIPSVEVF